MRRYLRFAPLLGGGALMLAATVAQAQPAPPSPSAAQVQAMLRGWFANLLAPAVTLPAPPLTVVADGAGFRITYPISALHDAVPPATLTARAHPRAGGIWAFDDVRLPDTGTFNSGGESWTWALPRQDMQGVIDPALVQPSTVSFRYGDVSYSHTENDSTDSQHIGEYAERITMIPGADRRLTVLADEFIHDWTLEAGASGQKVFLGGRKATLNIGRTHDVYRLEGINPDAATALFHAVTTLMGSGTADETKVIQQLGTLGGMLRDLVHRVGFETTLEDIALDAIGDASVRIDRLHLGFSGDAPDGRLDLWMQAGLNRLDLDPMPAKLKRLLPRTISVRGVISGVSTDALAALVHAALSGGADADRLQADALALLGPDGVRVGIERLAVAFDQVRVTGEGRVRKLDSGEPGFEMHLSASGLDALIGEAKKDRDLEPVLPFLMIAHSLGKAQGKTMTWTVEASAAQTLVNGVDVMALAQKALEPPKPAPKRKDQKKPSSNR